jgi:hypothetical protein
MPKTPPYMPPKLDTWPSMTQARTVEADGAVHLDSPSGTTTEAPELLRQLAESVEGKK